MKLAIFSVFLVLFISATACAWDLVSAPSPEGASYWKIVLDNGTEYNGTTRDGSLRWNIDPLDAGTYSGDAYFGEKEWVLNSENSTNSSGMVWSDPAPFTLTRNPAPDQPSEINLIE